MPSSRSVNRPILRGTSGPRQPAQAWSTSLPSHMLPNAFTRKGNKTPFLSAAIRPEQGAPTPATASSDAAAVKLAPVPPPPANLPSAAPILTEPSIRDDVEAGSDVRRAMRTALEGLEAGLDAVDRRGDAMVFFERLSRSGEKTVRQPPAAAQRALDLLRRDVAISHLVKLVEQDPVLAQSLLRYANSAVNATGARTTSLTECIRRVGTQGLRSVILSSMMETTLCRTGTVYDVMVRSVWEHMIRTAPIARTLAPAFGVVADEAFTLALLHDVGKLVIFDRLGSLRAELRRDVKMTPGVMPQVLRELHEVLGGAAALRWGLGKGAVAVVSTHHRRGNPLEPSLPAECVHIAERLDLAMQSGQPVNLLRWFEEGRLQASFEAVAPLVERVLAPDSGGTGFSV